MRNAPRLRAQRSCRYLYDVVIVRSRLTKSTRRICLLRPILSRNAGDSRASPRNFQLVSGFGSGGRHSERTAHGLHVKAGSGCPIHCVQRSNTALDIAGIPEALRSGALCQLLYLHGATYIHGRQSARVWASHNGDLRVSDSGITIATDSSFVYGS